VEHGAVQCGYAFRAWCWLPWDLLQRKPDPTRAEIREGLAGNLCRCTGYQKIVDAVQAAAKAGRETDRD
jgi:carbon-monoxide dehydrogenase small subunit